MIQPPALTPMQPMTFAPSVSLAAQLQQLGKTAQPLAKMAGAPAMVPPGTPGAPPGGGPAGPAPMDISPAATNAGTNVAQPGIMAALKGLSPQAILDQLRNMSAGGQQVIPPGMPGSAALEGAGMLSGPVAASGIPLNLMPGG